MKAITACGRYDWVRMPEVRVELTRGCPHGILRTSAAATQGTILGVYKELASVHFPERRFDAANLVAHMLPAVRAGPERYPAIRPSVSNQLRRKYPRAIS